MTDENIENSAQQDGGETPSDDPSDKSFRLAAAFMEEKGLAKRCMVCDDSNEKWMIAASDDGGYFPAIVMAKRKDEIKMRATLQFVAMICGNCGYARLHDLDAIAKWASEKSTQPNQTADAQDIAPEPQGEGNDTA